VYWTWPVKKPYLDEMWERVEVTRKHESRKMKNGEEKSEGLEHEKDSHGRREVNASGPRQTVTLAARTDPTGTTGGDRASKGKRERE